MEGMKGLWEEWELFPPVPAQLRHGLIRVPVKIVGYNRGFST
jgi:hypothetical protein